MTQHDFCNHSCEAILDGKQESSISGRCSRDETLLKKIFIAIIIIIIMLPKEILFHVFSILGSVKDIEACAGVSRLFRAVANEPALWKELADRKYSARVSEATVHLYGDDASYKAMMKDDNARGAFPTLHKVLKCAYRYNRSNYFFCCLITCIKWNRGDKKIRLYIDARGESDLREPWTSWVFKKRDPYSHHRRHRGQRALPEMFNPLQDGEETRCRYQSLLSAESLPGHYKGFLVVDEDFFDEAATYEFCYANRNNGFADYQRVELFKIKEGGSLADVFTTQDGTEYTLANESPFQNDDQEGVERQRWQPHVPAAVMNRPGWWVSQ